MSRYDNSNGGSNGSSNYDDRMEIKLQDYSTVSMEPESVNYTYHKKYGESFIANFENLNILDGIVFQREDKPGTWKVFSAGKFFHLNPEDGLVYENFDDEEGYSGEMSAQDVFDHPRVAGFSETFDKDYFYKPVGVVIESGGDIVVNEDLLEEGDMSVVNNQSVIPVGDASMMLSSKPWTRTFAKKLTEEGDSLVQDNGKEGDKRSYDSHNWLTTDDPTLRTELEGRELELWITEETSTFDGEEVTYQTPNLLDVKTGNFVTIDNGVSNEGDGESEQAAADGGTTTQSTSGATETESTESPDQPGDENGLPEGVPDKLDNLIDYMARNGKTDPDQIRSFSEDEVEDPDEIDWEAAAEVAERRS